MAPRPLLWLLSLAPVAALCAQEPAAPAAPVPLAFHWPVPATAVVTEKVVKRGRAGESRYRLELGPGPTDDSLLVRLRDFEFLALEGVDLADPKVRAAMAPQLALAQAIPDLLVGRDGAYRGVADVDAMIERFLAYDRTRPDRDPEQAEAVAARLRSPEVRAMMEKSGAAFWNCWAGHWTGHALAAGKELQVPLASLLPGVELSVPAVLRHHGAAEGQAGAVRLSLRFQASGTDAARKLLGALTPELLHTPNAEATLKTVRIALSAEAVLDPATLQPRSAFYEKVLSLVPPGAKEPVTQAERHDYAFAWQQPK